MSKPGRPNLSLAGKREAPTAAKAARGASTSTRGQRGRGGRGRGGGPRQKQELIQTGGVFSEGLGGDFPSRKKNLDADVGQFSYSKREKPATSSDDKLVKSPSSGEGKASFKGWDALWCSDEEGDEEELRSLKPEGFISDLRRGTVMPVVLPHEDEPQFKNVINKAARLALEEDDELIEQKHLDAQSKKKKEMTAEQLVQMLEASTSDLLHLQLPSVVATLCNHNIRPPSPIPMETDEAPPISEPTPSRTGLPESQKIGKLQVTRKGKLRLEIGGHYIDISAKKQTGKEQGTVLMEVEPTSDGLQTDGFQNQSLKKFENQLYHLGMVKHHLVGSMEWRALNGEHKLAEPESEEILVDEMVDEMVERRVAELHQDQQGWAALAEKWARGVI